VPPAVRGRRFSGLAPVAVDREADVGRYFEPNVWMLHAVR
jgi:hypothetical protein